MVRLDISLVPRAVLINFLFAKILSMFLCFFSMFLFCRCFLKCKQTLLILRKSRKFTKPKNLNYRKNNGKYSSFVERSGQKTHDSIA